jgi:glyoxalase family protein
MDHAIDGSALRGIHHVTAIASDPQPNLDFYVRFLGLRLVKRTVNFDDPETYHFYYGDEQGSPGTLLTFFPWPAARTGRHGTGQVTRTAFAIPAESLEFWAERARRQGAHAVREQDRFGQPVVRLADVDGLGVELVAEARTGAGTDGADIPAEHRLIGIHSATITVADAGATSELLVGILGFHEWGREGDRVRFSAVQEGIGAYIDVVTDPQVQRGLSGAGTVHHLALRTADRRSQQRWESTLVGQGFEVSPVMDRKYFHSIYFREPGGVLFEIATDLPGFTVDETLEELGSSLVLPAALERERTRIEANLPPITVPMSGLTVESY